MKKLSQKQLEKTINRLAKLKEYKSDVAKEEKELKEQLMQQLELQATESISVGNVVIGKKVSSYGIHVSTIGVKVTEATSDLTKSLLDGGKTNLLSIKPKTALLYQLQEQGDEETKELLEGLGIEVIEKHTIEIK